MTAEGRPALKAQIEDLIQHIEDTDKANAKWLEKQRKLIKLQFGPRDPRNFPWPDASNINVPLTDGIIRRFRPGLAALVFDANPVATFVSPDETDDAAARKAEPFWHWMFLEKMGTERDILRVIDLYANRGHAYTREGWRYETDITTRVVRVAELFRPSLQEWLQQRQLVAEQEQREFQPLNEVVAVLEEQYQMSANNPEEGPQLTKAADGILQGQEYVRITYREVKSDQPDMTALDPINVIVDQDDDIEDAEFFAIVHHFSADKILRMARDGKFDPQAAQVAAARAAADDETDKMSRSFAEGQRQSIKQMLNRRAGTNKAARRKAGTPRTLIWEIFAKIDYNGDGIKERVIIWWSVADKIPLAILEYPFPLDSWPITLYMFEAHADRPYESRGIPELLYDLQRELNADHNMRRDLGQLLLNPPLEMEINGMDPATMPEWRPGALYPVARRGSIGQIQTDLRPLSQLLVQENQTQRIAETYIGTFDATITNLSAGRERRTASEVNAITQLAANVFGLDARMFQKSFGRSLSNLWAIWTDLGDEETYFRAMGEEKPTLARKSEIGKKFDIKPAGTPSSTNRGFVLGNIERVMPVILQDQSGLFDKGELVTAWLELVDPKLAERIVRSADQSRAAQLVNQAAGIAAESGGLTGEIPSI